jgi:hypothetical protein
LKPGPGPRRAAGPDACDVLIVVPPLAAPGRIADQIPHVLEGLTFRWSGRTLLPDERVAEWIVSRARSTELTRPGRGERLGARS